MTNVDPKTLAEMEQLVEERLKYERWIQTLEDRRGVTPAHVFQRVLGDYQTRMRSVSENLGARSGDLAAAITDLRVRLDSMQKEESHAADERAEAELRAAVGEFTPDRWEEIRRAADEHIERLAAGRMELARELENLERILLAAGGKAPSGGSGNGRPSSGTGDGAPRLDPRPARETAAAAAAPLEAAPEAPRIVHDEAAFDELAFLSSVVETEIAQLPTQPADRTRADAPPRTERRADATLTPSASKIVKSATPLITEPVRSGSSEELRASEGSRDFMQARLSGSVPAYLRDVPKETTKSLKCQECGSMNYPTEWYCERCGGELAAL